MLIEHVIKPVCNSMIGWLGGKTLLRPTIINCFPKHECWVEVFCGSATVFFGKPPSISKIEIINDVNGELVNLMKVLSGTYFDESVREEFISYVRNMPASQEVYEDWKKWDEDKISKLNPSQRAFRYYYCVKKGFSSVPSGGFESSPLAGSRYNQNTDFDAFTNRFRKRNAQILRMDFRKLITKYNRDTADTFFYCDPPYFIANDSNYYEFVFTENDHNDLRKIVDEIDKNKNKFMLSYDDVSGVIDLYKEYHIYRTDPISYSASDERGERSNKKTELIITNYDLHKMFRKTTAKKDLFDAIDLSDKRIDFVDFIGLEKIN